MTSGDIRAVKDREAAIWNSNLLKLMGVFFWVSGLKAVEKITPKADHVWFVV